MHQSIPSVNIPLGKPPGFCIYFQPGSWDLCYLNYLGVTWGSDLLSVMKVPSCQLMLHEGTFQLQTDLPSIAALWLQNVSKLGENFKTLSMVLKLKLEGMTKEYNWTAFQFFSRFDFCKIPKFRHQLTRKAD